MSFDDKLLHNLLRSDDEWLTGIIDQDAGI